MPEGHLAGVPWNDDEIEKLLCLIEAGNSLPDLARLLGRSQEDVGQKAHFLGVLLPQHEAMPVSTRTEDSSVTSATIHFAPFTQAPRRNAA